jgi:type VI secretion system protein ImpG
MREELLEYYERELAYMRQMGAQFAARYPRVAGRLLLESDRCEDPHVERLLEGFAFLAARVHLRIDDDFPEITSSLLNIIYPDYLRPMPAITIVQCGLDDEQSKKAGKFAIPAGTNLLTRKTVDGLACRFRTCYDVDLWPFAVAEAECRQPERLENPVYVPGAAAVVQLRLKCAQDVQFSQLSLSNLSFYLSGETNVVHTLYELLANNCTRILLRDPLLRDRVIEIPPDRLRPMGFRENECLLPYRRRSFSGYRLLQEYFTFPEKFLFFELSGLDALGGSSFRDQADLLFFFSRFERPERQQSLELGVNAKSFRLGCTPAINLFAKTAEPILLTQRQTEYTVIPDVRYRDTIEVFSIDEVIAANPKSRESVSLDPVYSYRHTSQQKDGEIYWNASRRTNALGEQQPSTLHLAVVDIDGRLADPEADVLTVRATCTNFDLPSRLPFGAIEGDFEAEGLPAVKTIVALRRPTASLPPPFGKGQLWRLISHLSLNYLSLTEEGRNALQEILRLHNFTESTYLDNHVAGILTLHTKPHFALVGSEYGLMPARGTQVEIEFDEQQYVGGGVYLFATVLEHFLGAYASMNSFSQLVARTNQRKEVMREWPPRAGSQVLI